MNGSKQETVLSGPAIMLISAAIFGYFGFGTRWLLTSQSSGQLLLFMVILVWTLKISSVIFLLSGLLAFAMPLPANLVYSVTGLLASLAFLVVLVLDYLDKQHYAMSPLLLLIFAAWNAYGSITGIQAVKAHLSHRPPPDQSSHLPPVE